MVEVRTMLDTESNVFLLSPSFCSVWDVPKVQRDSLVEIQDFAGKAVFGVGNAFTLPLTMVAGRNNHTSTISCELGLTEPGVDLIILGQWGLETHPLVNLYGSWKFESQECQHHCSVTSSETQNHFEIEWDDSVVLDLSAKTIGMVNAIVEEE